MTEEQRYDLIERYLKEKLEAKELRDFEEVLDRDPALKADVEAQQMAMHVVAYSYEKELLGMVEERGKVYASRRKGIRWGVISSVLMVLTIVGFVLVSEEEVEEPAIVVVEDQDSATPTSMEGSEEGLVLLEEEETSVPEEQATAPKMEVREPNKTPEPAVQSMLPQEPVQEETEEETSHQSVVISLEELAEDVDEEKHSEEVALRQEEKNPCPPAPKVKVKTSPAHVDVNDGQLRIYGLEEEWGIRVVANTSGERIDYLEELTPGTYKVEVVQGECFHAIGDYQVAQSWCFSESDYAFSPDYQSTWSIPIVEEISGTARIMSPSGQVVFEQDFSEFETIEWDGLGGNGESLVPGMYKVFVLADPETCVYNVVLQK